MAQSGLRALAILKQPAQFQLKFTWKSFVSSSHREKLQAAPQNLAPSSGFHRHL